MFNNDITNNDIAISCLCAQTFALLVKAELENIGSLELLPGVGFCLDVESPDGGDRREGVIISDTEEYEVEGSRYVD